MSYLQTNIGDLKNELKKLQETTNAQIERLQNLLEKKNNPNYEKLSYKEQLEIILQINDTSTFIREYVQSSVRRLGESSFNIRHYSFTGSLQRSELEKKVKIESVNHLSGKEIPFDIFKCNMEDEGINQLTKNELIRQRGDKRYKIKEVNKWN